MQITAAEGTGILSGCLGRHGKADPGAANVYEWDHAEGQRGQEPLQLLSLHAGGARVSAPEPKEANVVLEWPSQAQLTRSSLLPLSSVALSLSWTAGSIRRSSDRVLHASSLTQNVPITGVASNPRHHMAREALERDTSAGCHLSGVFAPACSQLRWQSALIGEG